MHSIRVDELRYEFVLWSLLCQYSTDTLTVDFKSYLIHIHVDNCTHCDRLGMQGYDSHGQLSLGTLVIICTHLPQIASLKWGKNSKPENRYLWLEHTVLLYLHRRVSHNILR